MREKDDEWVEIMYGWYNQMLTEFSEVKGVTLLEPNVDAEAELLKQLEVLLKLGKRTMDREKQRI